MLHDIQQRFKKSILSRDDSVQCFINGQSELDILDRLNVYRQNTFVSLKNALLNIFPITSQLVSVEYFRYISDLYIQSNPPKQGVLDFYGQSFPYFLSNHESAKDMPFVEGVALLEWLIHSSYGAKDEIPLRAQDVSVEKLNESESLVFQKATCAYLLKTPYKSLHLYGAIQNKQSLEGLNINQPEFILVYRDAYLDVQIKEIDEQSYDALHMIFSGMSLNLVAENLFEKYKNTNKLQDSLALCFEKGLLTEIQESKA